MTRLVLQLDADFVPCACPLYQVPTQTTRGQTLIQQRTVHQLPELRGYRRVVAYECVRCGVRFAVSRHCDRWPVGYHLAQVVRTRISQRVAGYVAVQVHGVL